MLNLLLLVEQELLEPAGAVPSAAFSEIGSTTTADACREREGAWQDWIAFMLAAVTETAQWTTAKIRAIHRLQSEGAIFAGSRASKIVSRELMDVLFAQPYCRIQNLVDAGVAKRQTQPST